MEDLEKRFIENAKILKIDIDDKKLELFNKYYELLVEKNKVMNLTAITEYEDVLNKHFLDSILVEEIFKKFKLENIKNLLDVGTGAGFPGVPLKIIKDDLDIVLLDSLNKRIKFLKEVIENLGLEKITAIHGRSEEFAQKKEYREKFDVVVSRAVANLSTLSEYCIPFLKVGGMFISYKSNEIEDELKTSKEAIKKLGGEIVEVVYKKIPNTDIERSFVCVKKTKETNKKYPRKAGMPSKEPL